jgi:hypothetical protein
MKSSFSILALSLSSAFLAACAVDPATPAADGAKEAAAAPSDLICGREYMTGSNIAQTKCRTREQAEAERAAAERNLGRSTGGSNAKPGGG